MSNPDEQLSPWVTNVAAVALRVVLPLSIGVGCYSFLRVDSKFFCGVHVTLPRCLSFLGDAPDFLWAFAFCQALFLCGKCGSLRKGSVVLTLGILIELLQGVVFPGNPSLADMACYFAGCLAALFTLPHQIRNEFLETKHVTSDRRLSAFLPDGSCEL